MSGILTGKFWRFCKINIAGKDDFAEKNKDYLQLFPENNDDIPLEIKSKSEEVYEDADNIQLLNPLKETEIVDARHIHIGLCGLCGGHCLVFAISVCFFDDIQGAHLPGACIRREGDMQQSILG